MNKSKKKVDKPAEETIDNVVETPGEHTEPTEAPEPVEEITKKGVVSGCFRLNVRKRPKSDAVVLDTIDKAAVVTIDVKGSVEGWYKVTTKSGVKGYCMEQFIKIKA